MVRGNRWEREGVSVYGELGPGGEITWRRWTGAEKVSREKAAALLASAGIGLRQAEAKIRTYGTQPAKL